MDKLLKSYAHERQLVSSAPAVPVRVLEGDLASGSVLEVFHNPRFESLFAPSQGPSQPFAASALQKVASLPSGHVESHQMEQHAFRENVNALRKSNANNKPIDAKKISRRAKGKGDDAAAESFLGPWATDREHGRVEGGLSLQQLEELGRQYEASKRARPEEGLGHDQEQEHQEEQGLVATAAPQPPGEKKKKSKVQKKTGPPSDIPCAVIVDSERDYLGRSWVDQGEKARADVEKCYASKQRIATMPKAHTEAVTKLRAHKDGRLLLSSSLDRSVRVWGALKGRRQCWAEYWGHHKGVRDIAWMGEEQREFCSLGYDQSVGLWDLETGKLVRSIGLPSIGFCLGTTPSSSDILVGCNDAKIYQYDSRTGERTIEYDRHLGPVNSITFFDQGRRFISSSDDKTLRYWSFSTPVEEKIHQEPHMHSMPASAACEKIGWAAFQSMDNQILLYGIGNEGFKLNRKKRYVGHLVAGYSCGLDFSPDGTMIVSGDSEGKIFFWDVNTSKMLRRLQGHQGVVNSVVWHPYQASMVFSAGQDGKILVWD